MLDVLLRGFQLSVVKRGRTDLPHQTALRAFGQLAVKLPVIPTWEEARCCHRVRAGTPCFL